MVLHCLHVNGTYRTIGWEGCVFELLYEVAESLMYDLILGVVSSGLPIWFSVGPPHPLHMGLTAIGSLWIFFRKYICSSGNNR